MKIISKLLSKDLDLEARTGKFQTRKEGDKNWTEYTVNISPRLAWRIANGDKRLNTNQRLVNFEFTSENNSPSYKANPFQLTHFVPVNGSDIPEHYSLETVDEFTDKLRNLVNTKMKDYESVAHLLGKYVRECADACEVAIMADPSKRPYIPAKVTTAKVR